MRTQWCERLVNFCEWGINRATSGILETMWELMRRGLLLAAVGLAGAAPVTVPVRPDSQLQQSPSSTGNIPQSPSSALSEETPAITVVLDPAHGGADFGARGPTGLAEGDVVLDFARAARIALEAERLRVLLTREGNQDPSFDNRSAVVNGLHDAIFVSLHVSSSGPVGTARTYYYAFPSDVPPAATSAVNPANGITAAATSLPTPTQNPAVPQEATPQKAAHPSLIEWDHAQRSSIDFSRQLATLVQNELVPRFKGSPGTPIAAPVRQLRTIAAPAIAIEISSIDVTDAKRLEQMAQPLAEAISRAVAAFHYAVNASAAANVPSGANTPGVTSSGGH
jgi:N-acetylmuramoyl-L-alanine amidase